MKTFPLLDIKATEYIGNSLMTINNNFVSLSANTQDMSVRHEILKQSFVSLEASINYLNKFFNTNYTSNVCQIRMSCSKLYSDGSLSVRRRLKGVQSLFIHPLDRGLLSLYNIEFNTWETRVLPGVTEFSIVHLESKAMYDIFIGYDSISNVFTIAYDLSSSNKKITIDGILVHKDMYNMRYIGCMYKEVNGIEQTYTNTQLGDGVIKQHLWNNNNQLNTIIKNYNSLQNYTLPIVLPKNSKNLNVFNNTDGNKTFWNKSGTFSFICGRKTSIQVLYTTHVETDNKNAYIGMSLNNEYQPFKDSLTLVNQQSEGVCVMSCSMKMDVEAGHHNVYTFDASEQGVRFNVNTKSYYEVIFLN